LKANEFFKKVGIEAVKSYIVAYEDHLTDELKRLVESHELVGSYGGLESSKLTVNYPNFLNDEDVTTTNHRLSKAIADVESCMEVKSEN